METKDNDLSYKRATLGHFEREMLQECGKSWTICFKNELNCSEIAVINNYKKIPKCIDKIHEKGGIVVSIVRHFE